MSGIVPCIYANMSQCCLKNWNIGLNDVIKSGIIVGKHIVDEARSVVIIVRWTKQPVFAVHDKSLTVCV